MRNDNSSYFIHFKKVLSQSRDKTALIYQDTAYTYQELEAAIEKWQTEFEAKGIRAGDEVVLIGDFDPASISCFFALLSINTIIIPLLRSHTKEYIELAIDITHADHLIKIDNSLSSEVLKLEAGPKHHLISEVQQGQHPGLILFSSGSTGKPKAAVHNFSKLLSRFIIEPHYQRMINFLMFDHWGGLNTLLYILSGAGTVITTENRSPENICHLIEKWQVATLPTSPSFLNLLLLSQSYEGKNLDSLKLITYGSEPMPVSTLERARKIFPQAIFKQTYGLIELGVFKTKSKSSDSLFLKIDPRDCLSRIVDGKLELKTETAMLGYLNAESPFTHDGWFKTGDVVEVDGEFIRILGRDSEVINVGGEKVFPIEVEDVILQFPNVEDVFVYKEAHPLMGSIVCAKVKVMEKTDEREFIINLKKHCALYLARFKIPTKIKFSEDAFSNTRQKKSRLKL